MSWRKDQGRGERGYHHGNLKEALLQAALADRRKRRGRFHLPTLRNGGVSPAAPYRHFATAMNCCPRSPSAASSSSRRCADRFNGRPDTVTAFERVGRPISPSARNEPAFYSAMFESGLPVDANPTLMAASERAFAIIRAAAERLAALAPPGIPRPPAMMMALHIWSMSHGVASLFGRGDAARRKLPMSPEELLEAEVLIYLRGLGFPIDRRPSDQKPSGPPPVPPAGGPWGTPK
jgi:hypothetical protein